MVEGGSHVAADLARASEIRNIYDWYYATQLLHNNENLAKYSHKAPTRDELFVARVIGLANPGSFR